MFKRGDQVVFMPSHAIALDDPDCERGFVTSTSGRGGRIVFARFFYKTKLGVLRTLSASESVDRKLLTRDRFIPQGRVDLLLHHIDKDLPVTAWCPECQCSLDHRGNEWYYHGGAWEHYCTSKNPAAHMPERMSPDEYSSLYLRDVDYWYI